MTTENENQWDEQSEEGIAKAFERTAPKVVKISDILTDPDDPARRVVYQFGQAIYRQSHDH